MRWPENWNLLTFSESRLNAFPNVYYAPAVLVAAA
jgi:hypothetical protein